MSLAETQQLFNVLTEIDRLLSDIQVKQNQINRDLPRTKESLKTFTQLEQVALRYIALSRRLGLPDDVNRAIDVLARLVTTVRMAQLSIGLLLSSNPLTAAAGIASLGLTAFSMGDMLAGY